MKFMFAFAALALASAAAADMPQVQPGRYRCTPSGANAAYQQIVPLQPGREMRVAFRLIKEEKDSPHLPTVAVVLKNPKGVSHIALGKAVNDPFRMYVAVKTPDIKEDSLFEFPLTANWIVLKLKLDPRGLLTIRNNDSDRRIDLGSPEISAMAVNCHSGEFEIDVWPRSYLPAEVAPAPQPSNG